MELNHLFDSKLHSGLEELNHKCDHVLHIILNRGSTRNFSDFAEHHCDFRDDQRTEVFSALQQLLRIFN